MIGMQRRALVCHKTDKKPTSDLRQQLAVCVEESAVLDQDLIELRDLAPPVLLLEDEPTPSSNLQASHSLKQLPAACSGLKVEMQRSKSNLVRVVPEIKLGGVFSEAKPTTASLQNAQVQ